MPGIVSTMAFTPEKAKYTMVMLCLSTWFVVRRKARDLVAVWAREWVRRVSGSKPLDEESIPLAVAVVTEAAAEVESAPPPAKQPPPVQETKFMFSSSRVVSLGAEGCERLVSSLRDQRRVSWSPDVVVVSGGREFVAHAAVLEATSPVLSEAARRAPRDGDRLARVELGFSQDAEAMALVLEFAYGALVTLTEDNVEPLLELASKLRIGTLVDECCAFVAQRTSATRACRVLAIADKHKCTLLRRDVGLCVLRHFARASGLFEDTEEADEARAGFLALPRHLLDEILADDRLCVDDESVVFRAAVAWLEADAERAREAQAVLALVRYYLVAAEFLADAVEPHPLMQSRPCQDLVHAAYRWQALPPTRREKTDATPLRRLANEDVAADSRGGEASALHRVAPKPKTPQPDDSSSRPGRPSDNPFLSMDDDDESRTNLAFV